MSASQKNIIDVQCTNFFKLQTNLDRVIKLKNAFIFQGFFNHLFIKDRVWKNLIVLKPMTYEGKCQQNLIRNCHIKLGKLFPNILMQKKLWLVMMSENPLLKLQPH